MLLVLLDLLDSEEDKTKFEALYHKYDKLMMYIAMQKLHNESLAEEAAQDAWLYIAKNFNKVGEIDAKQTKSYLATIANGFAVSKFRKESKVRSFDVLDGIENDVVSDDYFDKLDATDLKIAMDKLDDEAKTLMYLTYVFGYTSMDIGDMLGISATAVRKRIQYTKARLRKLLEDDIDE